MSTSSHDEHGHRQDQSAVRSVALAAFLILAFFVAAFALSRQGLKRRLEGPAPPAPSSTPSTPAASNPQERPSIRPAIRPVERAGGPGGRDAYAARLEQGQRRIGRALEAKATGPDKTTLEVHWTRESKDQGEHLENLKKNDGFFAFCRELGFKQLVYRLAGKQVWTRSL